jgi:hypothetical protein
MKTYRELMEHQKHLNRKNETLQELSYKTISSYLDVGGKTEKGAILATNKLRK